MAISGDDKSENALLAAAAPDGSLTKYKIFHAVGVTIAEIKSNTLLSVVAVNDDNQYVDYSSTDLRFAVDMYRTPNRVGRVGKKIWRKVHVDDRGVDKAGQELATDGIVLNGLGVTSICSGSQDDPMRGALCGAVYLEQKYFRRLQATKFPDWPDIGPYALHQLTSIAYSTIASSDGVPINGARSGKRYHGFSAQVKNVAGNMVTFSIIERDATRTVTFAVGDVNSYDPDPPGDALGGQMSVASNLSSTQPGVLFVELTTAVNSNFDGVKLPIGEGH